MLAAWLSDRRAVARQKEQWEYEQDAQWSQWVREKRYDAFAEFLNRMTQVNLSAGTAAGGGEAIVRTKEQALLLLPPDARASFNLLFREFQKNFGDKEKVAEIIDQIRALLRSNLIDEDD